MKKENTQKLTVSAMMIAVATALAAICAVIPFLNLPWGGGFTVCSMLPIIIVSYMYGVKWGLFTGGVYAIIQMILGNGTIAALFIPTDDSFMGFGAAIAICIIDYILAYTALGLGGAFRKKIKNRALALCLGCVLAVLVRYICHVVSGYIFYGMYAEWFFGEADIIAELGASKWVLSTFSGKALSLVYSIVYNGCYMIPELIITALAAIPVSRIGEIKAYER
jgi:thiamine transporter